MTISLCNAISMYCTQQHVLVRICTCFLENSTIYTPKILLQVEKAFREGTAQQNAHSVFVSLALRLLEERVHIACKEIITLEKQVLIIPLDKI